MTTLNPILTSLFTTDTLDMIKQWIAGVNREIQKEQIEILDAQVKQLSFFGEENNLLDPEPNRKYRHPALAILNSCEAEIRKVRPILDREDSTVQVELKFYLGTDVAEAIVIYASRRLEVPLNR